MIRTSYPRELDRPDLMRRPTAVVASGPSLTGVDLYEELAGQVVIVTGSYLRAQVDGPVPDLVAAGDIAQLGWVRDYEKPISLCVTHRGKHNLAADSYRLFAGAHIPPGVDEYIILEPECTLLPGGKLTLHGSLVIAVACAQMLEATQIKVYGCDMYQIVDPDGKRLMFANYDEKLSRYAEWSEPAGQNALGDIMIRQETVDHWNPRWVDATRLPKDRFWNMSTHSRVTAWPIHPEGFPRS